MAALLLDESKKTMGQAPIHSSPTIQLLAYQEPIPSFGEEVMFVSDRFRSSGTSCAVCALLLSVALTTPGTSRSSGAGTGPDVPVWNVPNEGSYFGGPAIGPDGTIYIGTSEAGVSDTRTTHGLYAVDRNGRTKWKYTTGKSIKSSPVIGPDGTIYIMVGIGTDTDAYGLDSSLHAVDPQGRKNVGVPQPRFVRSRTGPGLAGYRQGWHDLREWGA